jgi:hypothetical protein
MRSFRLVAPACPCCGSAEGVALEKTPLNLLRVAVATLVAALAWDCVPLLWRCKRTGERFRAVSDRDF